MTYAFLRFLCIIWGVVFIPVDVALCSQYGAFKDHKKKYFLWQSHAVLQENKLIKLRRRRRNGVSNYKYIPRKSDNILIIDCPHWDGNFVLKKPIHGLHVQDLDREDNFFDARTDQFPFIREDKKYAGMFGHIQKLLPKTDVNMTRAIDILESFMMCYNNIKRSQSFNDFWTQMMILFKLIYGNKRGVVIEQMMEMVFQRFDAAFVIKSPVQSRETVMMMRNCFDGVTNVIDNELFTKCRKVFSFLLTQGLLSEFGITLNTDDFTNFDIKHYQKNYSSKIDMWRCILDTTITILERIEDYKVSGKVSDFIHGRGKYSEWLEKTDKLINLAPFTSNLEPFGTSQFEFISDLGELIEQGQAIITHTKCLTGTINGVLVSKWNQLKLIKATEITKKAAQQERPAPFGVLIHAKSSVGKSSFTRMLFNYFGKLSKLPTEDNYIYARSPSDDYWSGYDSSKWCIRLDDIGLMNPEMKQADKTVADIINVINNCPFVPPQAELSDKGKTPIRAKLVLATTNTKGLNAENYYACPLALMRRFEMIITLEVKDTYRQDGTYNGKRSPFLDTDKIRQNPSEQWPDYWRITVDKVVPDCQDKRDYAKFKRIKVFEDINEFLPYFGKRIMEFKTRQEAAMKSDAMMSQLNVCDKCYKTYTVTCVCGQSEIGGNNLTIQSLDTSDHWFNRILSFILNIFRYLWNGLCSVIMWFYKYICGLIIRFHTWYCCWTITYSIMRYIGKYRSLRFMASKTIVPYMGEKIQLKLLGDWCKIPKKRQIAQILAALGLCLSLYATYSYMQEADNTNKKTTKQKTPETTFDVQAEESNQDIADNRWKKESEDNIWYKNDFTLTTFDVPVCSRSLSAAPREQLIGMFEKNCVKLIVRYKDSNHSSRRRETCGVFVKGSNLLTNNHAFPALDVNLKEQVYDVSIIFSNKSAGITPNLNFTLFAEDICRSPEKDLAMIRILSVAPKKDILKYWAVIELPNISEGFFLRRNEEGVIEHGTIRAALLQHTSVPSLKMETNVYIAHIKELTKEGQCGSILVNCTPRGPVISGLHLLGKNHDVGYMSVLRSDIEALIADCNNILGKMMVCGGGEPSLNTSGSNFALTDLHYKSLIRYCDKGLAHVYGTLKGFRHSPSSKVCLTPKSSEVCEYFNYKVKHGAPSMKGWKPWRNNLIEMVDPTIVHSRREVHHVAKSFLEDIMKTLGPEATASLHVLTDIEAVNGVPGVKFIDSIKRSTSMGYPWCKTKKQYIIDAHSEKYPDGINFDDEVWARVEAIKEKYLKTERAFPIYTEHLKDEATSFEKIEINKTRAFSGAPVDMALVVRKYFLSFVKLLQENRFTFECAVGTNAMSPEWTLFHKYLTNFGEDKMVAGDYSKYDKKMIADFVLEAFWIIIEMHRIAGWSESDCQIMWGVATDTAYPLINFDGNLVEFFGTNPSGHPLTVIINSLVNSLYMRWMYYRLNPEKECHSFRKNVCLMTYGDDNIMGVSDDVPWFDHTSIQDELKRFGLIYTMPDKESESIPYVHINTCEFLKRKWRFDKDMKYHACPLNSDSILKSLTVWIPSSTICKEQQFVEVMTSMNMEAFQHGKEFFEKYHNFFQKILEDEDYKPYLPQGLPNWDTLMAKFGNLLTADADLPPGW